MTSKVAIVGPSSQPTRTSITSLPRLRPTGPSRFSPNCGNMLSAVGPFAIEAGLVPAEIGETTVRIFNRNTSTTIEAVVRHRGIRGRDRDRWRAWHGSSGQADVPRCLGSKTGAFLPTGHFREFIENTPVTLVDYAMPMVLLGPATSASPVMKRPMNSKPTWTSWTA